MEQTGTATQEAQPSQKGNNKKCVLPLHQRLSLIRMSRNLDSNREALRVLQNQGGWFAEQQTHKFDGVKDPQLHQAGLSGGVHSIDHDNDRLIVVDPTKGLRGFTFDRVLPDLCSQQHTYENTARMLVADLINGSNSTCLAYGQTGSGKTFTMFGQVNDYDISNYTKNKVPSKWGIVPRSCYELFDAIEYRRNRNNKLNLYIEASVSMSYIEIYGDKVSDLLRNRSPCGHSQVAAQRYVLEGSSEKIVPSFDDAMQLLKEGEKQKRTASTAMNEQSSRAHTILILTLRQHKVDVLPGHKSKHHQKQKQCGKTVTSRMFLVDLGGSEKLKKSQQGNISDRQERTKEAVNINLGLLALKNCAKALNNSKTTKKKSNGNNKNTKNNSYVPYADSKLTMLLSEGLGGNSKTCAVICAAQDPQHYKETLNSLSFGRSISNVSNSTNTTTTGNGSKEEEMEMLQSILRQIDYDISVCEEQIKQTERWETIEERIKNQYGEIEIQTKSILVGAESYRQNLEKLLSRRAELTGSDE